MYKQIAGSDEFAYAYSLQLVVGRAELSKGEEEPSALLCTNPFPRCCISWVVQVTGTGHNKEVRLGITLDHASTSTQACPGQS